METVDRPRSFFRTWRVFVGVAALLALYTLFEYLTLPDVSRLAKKNPDETALMRIRRNEAEDAGRKPQRVQQWRPLSQISPHLQHAVLVAEDTGFYGHGGIDFEELKEAIRINWEEKAFVRGASTLTQQLAKNLFLSPSKNPVRKIKEALLAQRLEKALGKRRILELYLNVVEMGDGIYGAEAASQVYFSKSAASLSPFEAATLAGMLINPRRYNPFRPSRRLERRRQIVLSRMIRFGYLSSEKIEAAKSPPAEQPAPADLRVEPPVLELKPLPPAPPPP